MMVFLTAFYLRGVGTVPFHPDESTQLFMSADFDRFFTDPTNMAWTPDQMSTIDSNYRLLDAPLTRYLLGAGRLLFTLPPLAADWDWSGSWEENLESGAFPDEQMLLAGRYTVASFYPLALVLLYLIGLSLNGRLLGLSIVLIFGTNALILLHTRRAMAEGALVFTFILTLYTMIHAGKRPLLTGLAAGLAFCSKQTAIAVFPIALLAVCWIPGDNFRKMASNAVIFISGFVLLTFTLNPFLWKQPVAAAIEAGNHRQNLLEQQMSDIEGLAPGQVLRTPGERIAVLTAQLSIAPPMFSEVGNYRDKTSSEEASYLSNPGNNLWRTPLFAGLSLGFFFLGILAAIRASILSDAMQRRELFLMLSALITVSIGLVLTVPLPWQRYSLPLIPLYSIFTGLGLTWLIENSRRIYSNGSLPDLLAQILSQFTPDGRVS